MGRDEGQEPVIEMRDIVKRFGDFVANDHVQLKLHKGEVLAILGENGAGKSTLMNILYGMLRPSSGEILVRGQKVEMDSPEKAISLGIGMVHQHFMLIPPFTVAENIILGAEPMQGLTVDLNGAKKKIRELSEQYHLMVDVDAKVEDISVGMQQRVEILKVLYRGADILILDEPTASLTPQEIDELMEIISHLTKAGKSILIITHKLNEVLAISDRVAVLRKGQYIGEVETAKADASLLTEMMVGEKVKLGIERAEPGNGPRRLRLENVSCVNAEGVNVLSNLSLSLQGGEILGIAGIAGNGQRELLEAIAGLVPYTGEIWYGEDNGEEKNLRGMSPAEIEALGVRLAFVPEDRLGMGLVGSMDLTDNVMLRSYRSSSGFVTDRKKPREQAEQIVEELSVATPGTATPIARLSGGNVQKVLVGREILGSPKVVMAAYPVRGLDIHSAYMIYQLLNEQKKSGSAVICVGEDLDVLLELCDRILVLQGGKSAGILDARRASKEELGRRMMGGKEVEA